MSGIRPSGGGGGGGGAGGGDDGGGGVKLLTVHYVIANAHAVSFPESWPGSTVCYTSGSLDARDDDTWRRNLDTRYVDGKLTWTHVHSSNGPTFFAYWPPYTYDRHLRLISDCSAHITTSAARGGGGGSSLLGRYDPVVESLGRSLEGREIECISVGRGELTAWIQHRQHLGETMAGEQ